MSFCYSHGSAAKVEGDSLKPTQQKVFVCTPREEFSWNTFLAQFSSTLPKDVWHDAVPNASIKSPSVGIAQTARFFQDRDASGYKAYLQLHLSMGVRFFQLPLMSHEYGVIQREIDRVKCT